MNYISLCLEGSRTSEFEPSDRKDIMYNKIKTIIWYVFYGKWNKPSDCWWITLRDLL
jgi:hypothetical protein